jgi:hypothetical protein
MEDRNASCIPESWDTTETSTISTSARNRNLKIVKTSLSLPSYDVDEIGNIWRKDGRRFSIAVDGFGYKSIRETIHGKRVRKMVHSLVAEKYIPNPENKSQVNHKDFDPSNNCVDNLEWVTPKENSAHSMIRGRKFKKLDYATVKMIREMLEDEIPQYTIASYVGINQSCVSDINTGVAWSWTKETINGDSSVSHCVCAK